MLKRLSTLMEVPFFFFFSHARYSQRNSISMHRKSSMSASPSSTHTSPPPNLVFGQTRNGLFARHLPQAQQFKTNRTGTIVKITQNRGEEGKVSLPPRLSPVCTALFIQDVCVFVYGLKLTSGMEPIGKNWGLPCCFSIGQGSVGRNNV